MRRVALGLLVAGLLAAPVVAPGSGGEQPAGAPGRADRASVICGDHGGVRTIEATRVVCFDGAPHGWDGSHP